MLKKLEGSWQFASENNLEDFAWSRLSSLFQLTPLKRQYRVYGDVCDILAVDETRRLVIIELKNAEDRYIVQQLTRYYHSLLEEKPFQQHINYQLPMRLIAVAPSFHYHNLVDRRYHKLDFEFISFILNQQQNDVYIQLADLDTKKITTEKVTNIADIKKVNFSKLHSAATIEIGGFTFTKAFDDILLYYVLVKNAYKLGMPELELSELERLNNQRYSNKVSKVFKIRVKESRAKSGYREVSIRVPSSIRVGDFVFWVDKRVSTATEVISPSGRRYTC